MRRVLLAPFSLAEGAIAWFEVVVCKSARPICEANGGDYRGEFVIGRLSHRSMGSVSKSGTLEGTSKFSTSARVLQPGLVLLHGR